MRSTFRGRAALAVAIAVFALPAAAQAAGKPVVTTGATSNLTFSSVTLAGHVTPNGAPTTYFFQFGPTILYGVNSTETAAPRAMNVTAPISGLAPATTYHYRLVARNKHGITLGKDRTFKTLRQPLGVVLAATPNPVPFGDATTLAGTLTGTGNSGRAVALQANPWPYTQGFVTQGNALVTDAQGNFSFPLLSVAQNTQHRVLMTSRPDIVSPVVSLGVALRMTAHTHRHRSGHSELVTFYGTVRPAKAGAQVAIQRLIGSTWTTINGTVTKAHSTTSVKYSKRVRIRRTGRFRVFIGTADGSYASKVSGTFHVTVHH
jgi:hypothetical protein